jgi:Asp-tRNA(Asn)/Glu-tRNA(Gln) amidotransferase A subunit family amidase
MWAAQRALAQGQLKGTPDWELIEADLRLQIEAGLTFSATDYAQSIRTGYRLAYELDQAMGDADVLITLAVAAHTPSVGGSGIINGEPAGADWVQYTPAINMTRNPAGVSPIGLSSLGLPLALQVIGRQRDDVAVLKTLCFLEDLLAPRFDAPAGV